MAESTTHLRHAYDRTIPADIEDVWRAVTDPDDESSTLFDSTVESSWMPGEPVRYRNEAGDVTIEGTIVDVDAPHRLVHTFAFTAAASADATSDVPTRVTWTMEPEDEGTRVTLVHDGFDTRNATWNAVEDGWEDILDGLQARFDADRDEDS